MDNKKKCVTMRLDNVLESDQSVLGSTANINGRAYVIVSKGKNDLHLTFL